MRVWTVHLPPGAGPASVPATGRARGEAVLLREGFSLGALLLGPLWLLWHGCWAAALGSLAPLLLALVLPDPWGLGLGLLVHLLLGWHGQDLRRWTLARRGYVLAHVVLGLDEEGALARLLADQPKLAPLFLGGVRA